MAEEQDDSQKTEEPSHRRLEEALEKGQVAYSREIANFLMLFALTLCLAWLAPLIFVNVRGNMRRFIESPHLYTLDQGGFEGVMRDASLSMAYNLMGPLLAAAIAAIAAALLQNGVIFSSEPVMPKLEKISPLKGLKKLFSQRSVVEFIKGLIKITVVGAIAAYTILPDMTHLSMLPLKETTDIVNFLFAEMKHMLIAVCVAMFLIAALDFGYQKLEFIRSMRMSRQELKDEHKQQEGDPHIKQRLRQIRVERARKRMMAAVPSADVVITNPTHFAVALKYETGKMAAPLVVAKGQDMIALKIREIAEEHGIPIVENPPLARTLFDAVDVDEEIPFEHYKAVAEIIGYVYRLKGKMK